MLRKKVKKQLLMKKVVILQRTKRILVEGREEVDMLVVELSNMKKPLILGGPWLITSMTKSSMMEETVNGVQHVTTELVAQVIFKDILNFKKHQGNDIEMCQENLRSSSKKRKKNLKIWMMP